MTPEEQRQWEKSWHYNPLGDKIARICMAALICVLLIAISMGVCLLLGVKL